MMMSGFLLPSVSVEASLLANIVNDNTVRLG